jgi:hypothetical protein
MRSVRRRTLSSCRPGSASTTKEGAPLGTATRSHASTDESSAKGDEERAGAQDDLQQVTRLARAMVTQLGMADELGPACFGGAGDDALSGDLSSPWEPKGLQ